MKIRIILCLRTTEREREFYVFSPSLLFSPCDLVYTAFVCVCVCAKYTFWTDKLGFFSLPKTTTTTYYHTQAKRPIFLIGFGYQNFFFFGIHFPFHSFSGYYYSERKENWLKLLDHSFSESLTHHKNLHLVSLSISLLDFGFEDPNWGFIESNETEEDMNGRCILS